jgi:hypothetical protein
METLFESVIVNLPNFAVAFVVLYWQSKMIDKLLDNQTRLLERLLDKAAIEEKTD